MDWVQDIHNGIALNINISWHVTKLTMFKNTAFIGNCSSFLDIKMPIE